MHRDNARVKDPVRQKNGTAESDVLRVIMLTGP